MRMMIQIAIIALIMILMLSVSGCGPSGRDISDAQWLAMQQDLLREREAVGRQRDMLESDRREWDERERSEPVLAAAVTGAALLICCCLPLLLIPILSWSRDSERSSEIVAEFLIDDAVKQANRPLLEAKQSEASADRNRLPGKS